MCKCMWLFACCESYYWNSAEEREDETVEWSARVRCRVEVVLSAKSASVRMVIGRDVQVGQSKMTSSGIGKVAAVCIGESTAASFVVMVQLLGTSRSTITSGVLLSGMFLA